MKSKKFTWIDAIIVLGVVAAVFLISKVMMPPKADTNSKVDFVIMATSIKNDVASELKKIEPGSTAVLSHVQKTNVEIKEITSKPHEAVNFNQETNEHVAVESKVNSDVFITVSADALVSDTAIQSGDVFIRVGNNVTLTNKDIALEGYIVNILS